MISLETISDPADPAFNVLLIPDIVFELLSHLDFCSLLTCQRVCRTWASAISRSQDAQQRLFLIPDDRPFESLKAAEATKAPVAFDRPSERISRRPEFKIVFNPWIDITEGGGPFPTGPDDGPLQVNIMYRRPEKTIWRYTNRVCSGRLDLVYPLHELLCMANETRASWLRMFLTQPPIKRVFLAVQTGYASREDFVIEKAEGVRIGDIMAQFRVSKAIKMAEEMV